MNNGLTTACLVLLNQLKQSVQKHPKRITAAVATLLLTGGGGAFAVASFAPDPADLPVRTVTQAVPAGGFECTQGVQEKNVTFHLIFLQMTMAK